MAPQASPGGGRGRAAAWVKRHKTAATAGAAVAGIAAIVLYERSKNGAGAASGGSGDLAPGTPATPTVFGGQQDPSFASLEAQITRLQGQVNKLTRARTKHPGKPPRKKPVRQPKPKSPHGRVPRHPVRTPPTAGRRPVRKVGGRR